MAAAGGVDAERLVAAIKSRLGCRGQPDAEVRLWDEGPDVGHMLAPEYVSLGPRQWDQYPALKRESEKLKRLNDLLFQAVRNNNNIPFEHFLSNLIDCVNVALGKNHQDHGSQQECSRAIELVKRMLLDGCYIVQVFANGRRPPRQGDSPSSPSLQETHRGLCKMLAEGHRCLINCVCVMMNTRGEGEGGAEAEPDNEDPKVGRRGVIVDDRTTMSLWRDTWFLVDNCVPYRVVDVINQLVYANKPQEGLRAAEAARRHLQLWHMYYCVPPRTSTARVQLHGESNYLLGQLADFLKPKDPNSSSLLNDSYSTCGGGRRRRRQEEGAERWVWQWQRATDYLRRCNARFVVSPLDGKDRLSMLDVTASIRGCFRSIDVRVPHLHINDSVLVLLRNLVELEQRGFRTAPCRYITAYCYFMYKIASKPEDVEFLQREGIIDHAYNDPMDVVQGLREVVEGASVSDYSYLLPIAKELGRRFYKSTVHKRLSKLAVACSTN